MGIRKAYINFTKINFEWHISPFRIKLFLLNTNHYSKNKRSKNQKDWKKTHFCVFLSQKLHANFMKFWRTTVFAIIYLTELSIIWLLFVWCLTFLCFPSSQNFRHIPNDMYLFVCESPNIGTNIWQLTDVKILIHIRNLS